MHPVAKPTTVSGPATCRAWRKMAGAAHPAQERCPPASNSGLADISFRLIAMDFSFGT